MVPKQQKSLLTFLPVGETDKQDNIYGDHAKERGKGGGVQIYREWPEEVSQ